MKKIITASFLIFAIQSYSQDALKMGNKIVGGGLSFSLSDYENERPYNFNYYDDYFRESTEFSFSPYYGRFYDDYSMLGLRFSLSSSNHEIERTTNSYLDNDDFESNSIGLGGFIRKYFPATEKFGFFLESGIDFRRGTSKSEYRSFELDQDSVFVLNQHDLRRNTSYSASIDAEGGMYFFLIPRLSIETNFIQFVLSYTDSNNEYEDLIDNMIEEGEGNNSNVRLNLINSFSFDKIFTVNYYF
ncbi:MAG: hypothetical protein AB8B73_07680 [Ekhidna sp.]